MLERRSLWPGKRAGRREIRWRGALSAAHIIRYDLALVALILCLLWGGIIAWVELGRRNLEQEALRTAGSIAGAAEQGVSRTIEAMDQRLRFAREAYRRDPAAFSLRFIAEGSGYTDGMMMQLAFIDIAGILRQTNLGPTTGTLDLSDRQHFRVQVQTPGDILYISVPVLGRVSKRWSVQFTRKVWNPDGSLAGVIVGSLDPYWMTQFQDALDVSGSLLLVGEDGVVRAAAPDQRLVGADIGGTPLGRAVTKGDHGSLLLPDASGEPGSEAAGAAVGDDIVSFRRLRSYALTIVVRLDSGPVFAPYVRVRRAVLAVGGGLTLLVLFAGGLMARNRFGVLASQAALRNAIENIDQGLVMVDGVGRLSVCNRRFTDLLGLPKPEIARGLDLRTRLGGGRPVSPGMHEETDGDGSVLEVRTHLIENGGMVRTYTNITERRQSEARILQLAHYDALTGLANRTTLEAAARAALDDARRRGTAMAVLCLDLDRFKLVNDTLGHAAGDDLLRQTGQRLTATLGDAGLVGRLGGDEFVALLTHPAGADQAKAMAGRIVTSFAAPFLLEGREMVVGVSIGIALFPGGAQTVTDLVKNADIALYVAKKVGRGGFQLFEDSMAAGVQARSELEQDLSQAIAAQTLCLHYQPIFGRGSDGIGSYEALLRWQHPTRGWVSPGEFIPIAEESRLILPLGRWVLLQACSAAMGWDARYGVAVNLSPLQVLDGNLPGMVADVLAQTGLDPSRLTFEVTEGVLIHDVAATRATLVRLKAQGVQLALDDFGTGYSSLSYLSRFPFDKLKIDRSFTQKLESDPGAKAIVQAIVALGRSLDLRITAEGIETTAQLDLLRGLDCDGYQGFLLGRPTTTPQSSAPQPADAAS